ncbi:phage holin family protein [Desulfovibrio desulfuricans]|uniref:phage holin family protein n=1 Tax=Desulfovibrio desulfuricans TaxID=876 RepID=UPI0017840980|nr:phage holin family protein [Desulfovibrio desulfuricans]MBD8896212.1 phage holin family protein [Desulfovibrio desulfuricans]
MFTDALQAYGGQLVQDFAGKSAVSAVCTVFAGMFGGVTVLALLLALLLACDYLLGFSRAWSCGSVSAKKARGGAYKIVFYALAVFVVAAVEHAFRSCGIPLPIRNFFIAFLCANEALSCLDHLSFFGVPVPSGIRARLRSYRDKILKDEGNAN